MPHPLDDLIDTLVAIRAYRGVDPSEGALKIGELQRTIQGDLRACRAAFVLEAGDPPFRMKSVDLARLLGVHPNKIGEMRREALSRERKDSDV